MIFLLPLILAHVVVLSKLIFMPFPELFVYPYLTNHGLLPYAQIMDQHFPGLMFLPINLNNLGVTGPNEARLLQFGIVILTHILLYVTATKLFKNKTLALSANIFYFLWQPYFEGWVLWIDSLIPLLLLPALYFLAEYFNSKKLKTIFISGLLLGIAIVFKQVVLPLAAVVWIFTYVKTRNFKGIIYFALGISLPVLAMFGCMYSIGVWNDFFFWTVLFNIGTYAKMGRKYATNGDIVRMLTAFGLPFIFAVLGFFKTKKYEILTIALFFVLTLAFAYARFDPVHLQPALVFVALLAGYSLKYLPKKYSQILLVIYLVPSLILLSRFYASHRGNSVPFFGNFEKRLVSTVQRETLPTDKIFSFGSAPHIYSLADRLPSGNVFVFQFPWFFVDAEEKILNGIVTDPPKLVIRDKNAQVDGAVLVEYAPSINKYIDDNYKVLEIIEGTEILEPK